MNPIGKMYPAVNLRCLNHKEPPMRLLSIILIVAALTFASPLPAADVRCPVDGSSAYFTGKSKVDVSGKTLWLYHCNQFSHEFWVVQ